MASLTQTQRDELEQALDTREAELQSSIAGLRAALAEPPGSTGPDVRDSGEDGQVRTAESQELTELDRCEREMGDISAARLRMRQGSYGVCEQCEEDIPFARLQAVPTAPFCLKHEDEHERKLA